MEERIFHSKIEIFSTKGAKAISFYEALGFNIIRRTSYGYTSLQRHELRIAISPFPWWVPLRLFSWFKLPPFGVEIVLYVQDLVATHQGLKAKGFSVGKIRLQDWGQEDFRIRDLDGYYIRISGY